MAVKGNYDQVNRLCSEVANTHGWGFVNINLRPYYSEGSKTLGFEVAEQLGWELPDHIVAPLASGSLFTKIYKGFNDRSPIKNIHEAIKIEPFFFEHCQGRRRVLMNFTNHFSRIIT